MGQILFITGTDTGVGKTVLTGLLLHRLRARGVAALAIKPFCSGSRDDVVRLQRLQPGAMPDEACNPFYFRAPLAPAVAALREGRRVTRRQVQAHVRHWERRCDGLLLEGAGGLLAPLGAGFGLLELLRALDGQVCVVGRNALGTINHVRLTVERLERAERRPCAVVLMDPHRRDASTSSNAWVLQEIIPDVPIVRLPYLGRNPLCGQALADKSKKIEKVLAPIFSFAIVSPSQARATCSEERVGKKR